MNEKNGFNKKRKMWKHSVNMSSQDWVTRKPYEKILVAWKSLLLLEKQWSKYLFYL